MKNFTAKTAHGTIYEAKDGHLTVITPTTNYTFKVEKMVIIDRKAYHGNADALAAVPNAPVAQYPELGKSIYVDGWDEWRLSTPVVSVVRN